MSTHNVYKVTSHDATEYLQNKRDALRFARSEAARSGRTVEIETATFAGVRYDESAVVIRRSVERVVPQ